MKIDYTVEKNLCMGCGICQGVCPKKAISVKYDKGIFKPQINLEQCIKCGICYDCCPGINVNFETLASEEVNEKNYITGKVLSCYKGKIKNKNLLRKCTSGGIITEIIKQLILNHKVDYAAVLDYDMFNNEPAYISITNDINKIMRASKSKYLPANISRVIEHVIKNRDKKYVIVGTSCQIQGIQYVINKFKLNKDNIILLGLFCDKTMNYNFYNYYEDNLGKGIKIKELNYRDKEYTGWPGDTKIIKENNDVLVVDKRLRMQLKEVFQVNRCRYCIDKLNQFADISFGDCYDKSNIDTKGKSSIIVRTELGEKVLNHCKEQIELEESNIEDIIISQKINEKKINLKRAQNLDVKIYKGIDNISINTEINKLGELKFLIKNTLGTNYSSNPNLYSKLINRAVVKKDLDKYLIKVEDN